jgi:hypothetical protein
MVRTALTWVAAMKIPLSTKRSLVSQRMAVIIYFWQLLSIFREAEKSFPLTKRS